MTGKQAVPLIGLGVSFPLNFFDHMTAFAAFSETGRTAISFFWG